MSVNGPTRSQSTNRLIQTWLDAAEGRLPEADLVALLDERERGLLETRADFVRRLDGQPSAFVAAVRPFHDNVLRAMDRYGACAGQVRAWMETHDSALLASGPKQLAEAGEAVLDALAAYDMAVLAERGPTPHALLNGLVKAVRSPQVSELTPMLAQARALLMQAATDGAADPAVARLRAGATAYLAALDVIEQGDRARGASMIEDAARRLEDGAALLREGARAPGPTLLPVANALIHAADAIREGRVPSTLVEEVLHSLEAAFARMRPALSRALRGSGGAAFAEEAERARGAMAQHESALSDLRAFLETGSTSSLDSGLAGLQAAVLSLQAARAAFDVMAEREGKVVCVWCDHANEPATSHCAKCARMLPRWMDDDAPASTFSVGEAGDLSFQSDNVATEHLQRLTEASELAASGEISPEACLEVVSWLDGLAAEGLARLDRLPAATDESDRAREALTWMRHGLEQMRRPLLEGDATHLEPGLRTVQEGARALHDAQRSAQETMAQP